jgi:hypothetical protein
MASPPATQYWAGILLAQIAYIDEADLGAQRAAMQAALQQIQPAAGGPWTMTWGPATDQGILAFVAANATGSTYALVFRGSLADADAHDFCATGSKTRTRSSKIRFSIRRPPARTSPPD